jgi:hypothetical protein
MADAQRRRGRKNAIVGQFATRTIDMLESPAYRVLSRAAHQVLSRLEIEHAHHGGRENGRLPCPYDHFVEYGLHRHAIAPAIRELCALGFVEVTRHGAGGNADQRRAALYRLTHRHVDGSPGDGTHEWRKITTIEEADRLVEQARLNVNRRSVDLGKKQKASAGKRHAPVTETITGNGHSPVTETITTGPSVGNRHYL